MLMVSWSTCGIVCLMLFYGQTHASISIGNEMKQVKVEFDFVVPTKWDSSVISEFRSLLSKFAGSFCHSNLSACGLTNFSVLLPGDVVIVSGYPQLKPGDPTDSIMLFYINLPSAASGNIPKAVLEAIIIANKIAIQNGLKAVSSGTDPEAFRVSYVNDKLVLTPVDSSIDVVVIPVVCGLVLIMSLVIIGLEINRSLQRKALVKELEKRRANQSEKSKSTSAELFQARQVEESDNL